MISNLDPAILYKDLETDLSAFGAIMGDRNLAIEEFVSTHRETIRRHYAKAGGYPLDRATAHQAAVTLFRYLRPSPW
ncbi:hypothetical protein [Thiocystis violacea]|uniref:hypothetical protein n=1 Tax=Thiocystis violacea TaxID=13725 RepID=UPI00190662F8|nr:hypothetical protein [Thiocystis violacea]